MKKNKKEKPSKEASHAVQTPPPPQVMDPSVIPVKPNKKQEKKPKPKNSVDNPFTYQKNLTPMEESWY